MGDRTGALLTAEVRGSFGIMEFALLAWTPSGAGGAEESVDDPRASLTADLLRRGFRPACDGDFAEMALRAQPADGTIVGRVTAGRVSLVVDDRLVWTQRITSDDEETARWIKAAQTREVTLISGDHLLVSAAGTDTAAAAVRRTLVTARIPTTWF